MIGVRSPPCGWHQDDTAVILIGRWSARRLAWKGGRPPFLISGVGSPARLIAGLSLHYYATVKMLIGASPVFGQSKIDAADSFAFGPLIASARLCLPIGTPRQFGSGLHLGAVMDTPCLGICG